MDRRSASDSSVDSEVDDIDDVYSVDNYDTRHFYTITKTGRCLKLCRELYLRDNIPCRSGFCWRQECVEINAEQPILPTGVHYYLLPDTGILTNFFDILEITDCFKQGLILTQTVIMAGIRQKGRHLLSRLREKLRDDGTVLFLNHFHNECFAQRAPEQNTDDYYFHLQYRAAEFYYRHLNVDNFSLIILTENSKFQHEYAGRIPSIFVCSLGEYLRLFKSEFADAIESYSMTKLATEDVKAETKKENCFDEHLPTDQWRRGVRSGRYKLGVLRVSKRRAATEAFVTLKSQNVTDDDTRDTTVDEEIPDANDDVWTSAGDVLIDGLRDRNRAISNDDVVIMIYPKSEWKSAEMPRGKVVAIAKRRWRDYVCTPDDKQTFRRGICRLMLIPYDFGVPKICLMTSNGDSLRRKRLQIRLSDDCWPSNSLHPTGRCLAVLGDAGDLETDLQCILLENGLNPECLRLSPLVEAACPRPEVVQIVPSADRRDLRQSHLIFSIDPPNCQDVDDALSVKLIDDNTVEFGVHIADVTHFVKPNSPIDREAAIRGNTVYLTNRRYDMLPSGLAADLCSLWNGKDRYAISVIWTLNRRKLTDVRSVWFGRSILRSRYKLEYEQAQAIFDGSDFETVRERIPECDSMEDFTELAEAIQLLARVAAAFHEERSGLELENAEIRIRLNEDTQTIQSVLPKPPLLMHSVIAECMIFANRWVAERIYQSFPSHTLLRRHGPPSERRLHSLQELAAAKGFSINSESNRTLDESLERAVDPADPAVNSLIRQVAVTAMQQAEYISSGGGNDHGASYFEHYGLNLAFYTHFTSPIRRYADVVVHRLLLAALDQTVPDVVTEPEDTLPTGWKLSELCDNLNERHRSAQIAERASTEFYQALYFKQNSNELLEGIISGVKPDYLMIYASKYGLKAQCRLNETDKTKTYRLFDRVLVNILVIESLYHAPQIQFQLTESAEIAVSAKSIEVDWHNFSNAITRLKQLKISADNCSEKPESFSKSSKSKPSAANNYALNSKRRTLAATDVIEAMKDMEFESFVDPLKSSLDAYRAQQPAKGRKTKSSKEVQHSEPSTSNIREPIANTDEAEFDEEPYDEIPDAQQLQYDNQYESDDNV